MVDWKIKIIIADDNKEFCDVLNDYISTKNDIIVTGIAKDGVETLKLIEEKKPHLVLLDINMPALDGLKVLESLNIMDLDPKPLIIVLSPVGQDKITQRAISLGANYYIDKPFDIESLVNKIRHTLNRTTDSDDVKKALTYINKDETKINISKAVDMITQITNIFHEIGVPTNIKGYMYLREAITLVVNNIELLLLIREKLYPLVGEKFNTTASRVERLITQAVEGTWTNGQVETINKITDYTSYNIKNNPTNSEFIAMVTNMLILKNMVN